MNIASWTGNVASLGSHHNTLRNEKMSNPLQDFVRRQEPDRTSDRLAAAIADAIDDYYDDYENAFSMSVSMNGDEFECDVAFFEDADKTIWICQDSDNETVEAIRRKDKAELSRLAVAFIDNDWVRV
jgi:hypothetical protein